MIKLSRILVVLAMVLVSVSSSWGACYSTIIDGYKCYGWQNYCNCYMSGSQSCNAGDNCSCGAYLNPPSTCVSSSSVLISPQVSRTCRSDREVRIYLSWGWILRFTSRS